MLECQEWAVAPVEPHGIPAALHDATTAATHRVSIPRVGTGMGLFDRGPMGRQDRTQAFPAGQRCYTESIGVNDVVVLQQVRDLVRSRFDCFHVSTGREPSGITTHRLKRNRPAECCGGVDF